MKRILVLIAPLLATIQANAAAHYWCDCLSGADGACVAGNDANAGTSPGAPWKTFAKLTAALFSGLPAGDQLLFCKGGSISGTAANFQNIFLQNLNSTAANPIVFDSYDPGWGAGAKPILTAAVDTVANSAVFNLQNSGNSRHDKGYIIRNLSLKGGPHYLGTSTGSNSTTTLNDTGATWGNLIGYTACLYAGTAANNTCRTVSSNTATQITVSSAWPGGTPDATTKYWLRGATYGINSSNDVWDVLIQNVVIDGFGAGVNCSGGGATGLTDGDGTSQFWTVRESTIQYNDNGFLSGCSNVLLENNTFDHNSKPASALDHSIYLDDGLNGALVAYPFRVAVIRHNTITNSSILAAGNCATTIIVVHGQKTSLEITDNDINEPTVNASSGGCWPISVNHGYFLPTTYSAEGFDATRILRNKLTNFGLLAIDIGNSHGAIISDNSMYTEYVSGASCIELSGTTPQDPTVETNDYQSNTNWMVGNSCYIKTPTAASIGYRWNKHASDSTSSANVVANNLTYFGTGVTTSTQCFNFANYTAAAFSYFDKNLCFGAGGVTPKWHSVSGTKAQWTTDSGGLNADANSLTTDPQITTPTTPLWSLAIPTGSPANAAGTTTYAGRSAFDGCARPGTPSIGATEYRASACTPALNSPSSLR